MVEVTYHVTVDRGERYWLVHVQEIDRWTQARTLREVEDVARDLVVVMDQVNPESVGLDITVQLPESVQEHVHRARRLRAEAATAQSQAAAEWSAAARELRSRGLSVRDVAAALDVSPGRVQQLVS